MKKPCPHCPFRTDCLKGWLGAARAEEIAESITDRQQTFPCHETCSHEDGEHIPTDEEQHCAGAMILLEKINRPNQMMRIAERLRMYDHTKLDMTAPVFDDVEDFIDHHDGGTQRGSS